MRLRGVWTANAAARLIGVRMYASFLVIPEFVQVPVRLGYGFDASVTGGLIPARGRRGPGQKTRKTGWLACHQVSTTLPMMLEPWTGPQKRLSQESDRLSPSR